MTGLLFCVGFALQNTLGNLASGLRIMILKPFVPGLFLALADGRFETVEGWRVIPGTGFPCAIRGQG